MRLLVDTNAYSAFRRGHPRATMLIRAATEILLSTVVAGELLHGFRCGSRYAANLELLQRFMQSPHVTVIPVTLDTAYGFARVAAALTQKGTPIPTNDIWLAAKAMDLSARLVSFDQHFGRVDGLDWVNPDE